EFGSRLSALGVRSPMQTRRDRRVSELMAEKNQQTKTKGNNESSNSLQKNNNSSNHIPKPRRDVRVCNNRSRAEPLRLSSSPSIARNPRIHARWDTEYLRFGVVVPPRVGL